MNRAERRRQRKKSVEVGRNGKAEKFSDPSSERQPRAIEQALNLANQHRNAGHLSQAESICEKILQNDPNQPVALHLMGVIAHQEGRNDAAVDRITRALAIQPGYTEAHNNLGNALQDLGRFGEAVISYRKALAIKPDLPEAHNNLGNALLALGKLEEAVGSYREAVRLKPDYAEAHNNLGNALRQPGTLADAVLSCRKAIDIRPDYAEAHNNLGLALQDLGNLERAMGSYRKALDLKPENAMAHNNLGNVLKEIGLLEEAEHSYRTSLAIERNSTVVLCNLGNALRDIAYEKDQRHKTERSRGNGNNNSVGNSEKDELWKDVLDCANQVLSLKPSDTSGLALKATALIGLNRPVEWGFLCDFDRLIQAQVIDVPAGYEDLKTFNEALLRRCAEDKSESLELHKKAIRGGRRINYLHEDQAPGPVSSLLELVEKLAHRFRARNPVDPKHPFLTQSPSKWKIIAWGSILGRQGHHVPHIHSDGWLSGVYYGKLPKIMRTQNEKHDGCIEFGQPENYVDKGDGPDFRILHPQEGTLILFPSYFHHRTFPFEVDDTRFTVSFDLVPFSV